MKLQVFSGSGFAIKSIAASARRQWAVGPFVLILTASLLGGCSVVDKPQRPIMYDFGPGLQTSAPVTPQAPLPPLAIDDIATPGGSLENMTVLYRLAYTDEQQLRPYSLARWSMPPAQLIRQRLREKLSQRRAIFNAGDSLALNRAANAPLPMLLRIELQEFSQLFTAPDTSVGLIRLRATLAEVTPSGERLVGQRNLALQRPAATGDAPGGVRALTAATDAAIEEIDQWLQQTQAKNR
jgi:cholesterol transport system auxiliary component